MKTVIHNSHQRRVTAVDTGYSNRLRLVYRRQFPLCVRALSRERVMLRCWNNGTRFSFAETAGTTSQRTQPISGAVARCCCARVFHLQVQRPKGPRGRGYRGVGSGAWKRLFTQVDRGAANPSRPSRALRVPSGSRLRPLIAVSVMSKVPCVVLASLLLCSCLCAAGPARDVDHSKENLLQNEGFDVDEEVTVQESRSYGQHTVILFYYGD